MPLTNMEHYLVLTDDVDRSRDFYRDVLGFEEGYRPPVGFAGYWLYLGDTPCIHIADRAEYATIAGDLGLELSAPADSTGSLDHIAFNATGFADTLEDLRARDISIVTNRVPGPGFWQIFLHDPDGLKIELNFPGDTDPALGASGRA